MPFTVQSYIPSVKPGAYQAVCTDVEEKAARSDPSNIFRVWHFQLTDGSQRMIDGTSSLATSPKSKGGKWVAALIGHAPAVGEEVAPEGRPCTIIVAINDAGYEYVETVAAPAVAPIADSLREATDRAERNHAIQEEPDALPF
jgi:hypothetical protein